MRTALPNALRGPIGQVVTSFGDLCSWRRPDERDTQPDNSLAVIWERAGEPLPVVLSAMSEAKRLRVWGARIEGSVEGLVQLDCGVEVGDILRPQSGSWCGQALEVTGRQPIDLGTVAVLALRAVPDQPTYG